MPRADLGGVSVQSRADLGIVSVAISVWISAVISGRSRRDLSQDDLTIKLSEIVTVNNIIRNALAGGRANIISVMEDWVRAPEFLTAPW